MVTVVQRRVSIKIVECDRCRRTNEEVNLHHVLVNFNHEKRRTVDLCDDDMKKMTLAEIAELPAAGRRPRDSVVPISEIRKQSEKGRRRATSKKAASAPKQRKRPS